VSDANPAPQRIFFNLNITAETAGIAIICLGFSCSELVGSMALSYAVGFIIR
jgi:hypothetical protein